MMTDTSLSAMQNPPCSIIDKSVHSVAPFNITSKAKTGIEPTIEAATTKNAVMHVTTKT